MNVQTQFTNLRCLEFSFCLTPSDSQKFCEMFKDCKHLEELVACTADILKFTFPKLKKIQFHDSSDELMSAASAEVFNNFLRNHENLTVLNYSCHPFHDYYTKPHHITEMQHLKELEIHYVREFVSHIINNLACNMSLERIEFNSVIIDNNFVDGIQKMHNLRLLTLNIESDIPNQMLFDALGNLSHLVELKLYSWPSRISLTSAGLLDMVTRLDKLMILHFEETGLVLSSDEYDSIVQICRNRKKKNKLFLFNNERAQHEIPQAKAEMNYYFVEFNNTFWEEIEEIEEFDYWMEHLY